ncbi:M16 family metallopeptidase [Azonexus sp. IMCC34842]|uniref:M16 family metallopeptidase n=1 Tax=Azonexus sp. IMCC34842 TaxID=3420950 RepID=UPI003D0EB2A9
MTMPLMSRLFRAAPLALAMLLPFPGSAAPPPAWQLEAEAGGFSSYRLANGFKIILAPFPAAATARIELLVKVGSKQEGYGESGMAHLLEHMLFKSAGRRADLKSELTALGATWNGTTTAERTNYFETVVGDPDTIDEAIRIEADRFIRPTFTRAHLVSEMTVVRNELERKDNDPNSLVIRALQRQSYFWHGYGRSTIGARSDIEEAPFAALQAFHQRHYRPDNAALIVSGKFDSQRVLKLAGRLFAAARLPATPRPATWTREEARAVTNRSELFLAAGKVIGAAAWKLPGMNERETLAVDLASTALCAESWGSLRRALVLEQRLAIGVSCGVQAQPDYSLLLASASAGQAADAEALSRALLEHVERFAQSGISAEQLERARRNELNAFERLGSAHESFAARLSQAEVAGDWRLFFRQRDIVADLTLEEANQALKKWLIGINRSDVLLRHAEGATPPTMPKAEPLAALLAGRDWAAIAASADPLPTSLDELAAQVVAIPLDGQRARAELIARRTQGNLAWVSIANDYGNAAALSTRQTSCALASSLMAYGGGGLDREALAGRLEALQARGSIGLGGISLEAPRANIEAGLDLLLAAWKTPLLPVGEFERLKAARLAGLEAALKDPAQLAGNAVARRFDNYPADHPFRPRSLAQARADVEAVDIAEIRRCIADFSGISQIRLAVVGDFSRTDVEAMWARLVELPPARQPYERIRDIGAPTGVDDRPVSVARADRPNADVQGIALLRITEDDPDFPALRIAVRLLGGDTDSRIRTRLREREGLAYSAGAALAGSNFEPRSRLSISTSVASSNAENALAMLKEELARALAGGFSEAEVTRAKSLWKQERSKSLTAENGLVRQLSQGMYSGRDYAWLARFDRQIEQLGAAAVTEALRKYLADTSIVWSTGKGL